MFTYSNMPKYLLFRFYMGDTFDLLADVNEINSILENCETDTCTYKGPLSNQHGLPCHRMHKNSFSFQIQIACSYDKDTHA